MAFCNEYVAAEDSKKYDLDGIRRRFGDDPSIRYQWTIDRDRDVFLLWMGAGREEFAARQTFFLWWKGASVQLRLLSATSETSGMITTIWKFQRFDHLPPELTEKKDELLHVLKEALVVYKVSGIGFPVDHHTAIFEF